MPWSTTVTRPMAVCLVVQRQIIGCNLFSYSARLSHLCEKRCRDFEVCSAPSELRVLAMPIQKVRFWDPDHWRFRAEEARTVADQMTHEEARTIMRRIANDYGRLAKFAQLAAQKSRAIERAPRESPRLRRGSAARGSQRQPTRGARS